MSAADSPPQPVALPDGTLVIADLHLDPGGGPGVTGVPRLARGLC